MRESYRGVWPRASDFGPALALTGVGFWPLIRRVQEKPTNGMIAAGLVAAIVLWGQNNAATKYLSAYWPPLTIGVTRFLSAGLILLAVLHWTNWLGRSEPVSRELNRRLWRVSLLSLAVYITCYTIAIRFTSASNVALHLGTAPVWALIWEERPRLTWRSAQSYGAALLALFGVIILVWFGQICGGKTTRGSATCLALAPACFGRATDAIAAPSANPFFRRKSPPAHFGARASFCCRLH